MGQSSVDDRRAAERKGRTWVSRPAAVGGDQLHIEPLIRVIPDFPIPGILFRDITPLLKDAGGFHAAIELFVERYRSERIDLVVAMEARGYIFGAPLAYALGAGFVPVRKPGKLPGTTFVESYALEYGTNTLEIHDDAVGNGQRVLVVDDLLATGGTAAATARLLAKLGADVVGFAFLIELGALEGRKALAGHEVTTFVSY
ncbi:MAG: adenine phosphoribosyltransferase [Candidatus Velthaea sp.]